MIPVPIIMMIVSAAINYANRPKIQAPRPAAFEDFDFPVAEEGSRQYVIFGDVWIKDWTVLSYGNMRTSKIQTKGGKSGIGNWVPGILPINSNPIEAWLAPKMGLDGLLEYDPFHPEEPDNSLPALLAADTWIEPDQLP